MKLTKKLLSLTNMHLFCLFCLSLFYFLSSIICRYGIDEALKIEDFMIIFFITLLMLIFLNILNVLRFCAQVKNKKFNDSYISLFTSVFSLILAVAGTSFYLQKIDLIF